MVALFVKEGQLGGTWIRQMGSLTFSTDTTNSTSKRGAVSQGPGVKISPGMRKGHCSQVTGGVLQELLDQANKCQESLPYPVQSL